MENLSIIVMLLSEIYKKLSQASANKHIVIRTKSGTQIRLHGFSEITLAFFFVVLVFGLVHWGVQQIITLKLLFFLTNWGMHLYETWFGK